MGLLFRGLGLRVGIAFWYKRDLPKTRKAHRSCNGSCPFGFGLCIRIRDEGLGLRVVDLVCLCCWFERFRTWGAVAQP